MYRLHGQDASWLYRETLTTPMHTLKIFLVKLGEDHKLDFESVRALTAKLLHETPMFRQRPVFIPFRLHHPVMVEDPEFDLQYHLNRAALPAPGGTHELEELIAHIASHPLDQTRPLWQFWVIEGLEDGRIALVQKIHHTLADGMASVNFLRRLWESEYNDPDIVAPAWEPEALPSKSRLLLDAFNDHIKHDIRNLPSFFTAIYRSSWALKKVADPVKSPMLKGINGDIPRAPWNRALSSQRSFAVAQMDLEQLKILKNALGGTLNDLVLAIAAGSLRNYLTAHGHPTNQPLMATIPVSSNTNDSGRESGNATAVTATLLHIEIADPVERFNAIRASSELGKAELEVIGRETFGLMLHYIPPLIQQWAARRGYNQQLADAEGYKPPANLSVSNVPGPRTPFAALGNVVEDFYSVGPLVEGMGLNITVWSYSGKMNFSLLGCRKAIPNMQLIADGLQQSLAELQEFCSTVR